MPTDMSQVRVHGLHRWTILVRYRISLEQANHIAATSEPEINVTDDAVLDVFGQRCLDCQLTLDTAPHLRWCDALERID